MSPHAADEPADAQRDSHRGIRPTFDSVAKKLFQRCSLFLHRPRRVANGIFRLPIRLSGGVLGLSISVLGGTGCLLELSFYPGLHVASGASKSLLDTTTHILGGASKSIFIHRHDFCSLRINSVGEQPRDDLVRRTVQVCVGAVGEERTMPSAAALIRQQAQETPSGIDSVMPMRWFAVNLPQK